MNKKKKSGKEQCHEETVGRELRLLQIKLEPHTQLGLWIVTLTYQHQAHGASSLFGYASLSLRKHRGESGQSEGAAAVSTDAHEKHSYSQVPRRVFIFWQFSPLAKGKKGNKGKIFAVFTQTSQLAIMSHLPL